MIRDKIIDIAKLEEDYVEEKSNLTKYGKWYGMDGVAWCAIFVSWVYHQSGSNALKDLDTVKGYHYCPSAYNKLKKANKITTEPFKGDIVFFDWNGDKLSDHTGIFLEWTNKAKGEFLCIEGNTSLTNNSNGGQVMIRKRYKSRVLAFANVL